MQRRALGKRFEEEAVQWLLKRRRGEGPERVLLGRNLDFRLGELDLVIEERAARGDAARIELVFVEVRYRSRASWVSGVESVDSRKQARLLRAARIFLAGYRGAATQIRFDVLATDGCSWTHLENAWYPHDWS